MANRAIGLHDSEVLAVDRRGADMVVRMSFRVHESDGDPGRDPGTDWRQEGLLVVEDAVVAEQPADGYLCVREGALAVGGQPFAGALPLPFEPEGSAALELTGREGALRAAGRSVRLLLVGTPVFVDDFPGA